MPEVRSAALLANGLALSDAATDYLFVQLQPAASDDHERPHLSGEPFSKDAQLARGTRRYRRKVASPKQWQAIIAAKVGRCRVCGLGVYPSTGAFRGPIEYHHLLSRAQGGDDVEDNIVPLHNVCHGCVTSRLPSALAALAASLTHSEYAYLLEKVGEPGIERLFGVPGE